MSSGNKPRLAKPPEPRYAPFDVYDVTYKTVDGHPIDVSILVPKNIEPGNRPLMVRFHGGGLVEGVRLGDWFREWILDLAIHSNAILLSPDYRLLPESTGADILSDLSSFWTWVSSPNGLTDILQSINASLSPSLSKIFLSGESAGSYMSLQSALLPSPARASIRCILLQSPLIDIGGPHFTQDYPKPIKDFEGQAPFSLADEHLAKFPRGRSVVAHADPGPRTALAISMIQHGRFREFLGDGEELYPLEKGGGMETLKESGGIMCPVWIVHGHQDSVCPVGGVHRALEKMKTLFPATPVHVHIEEGEHGLDSEWMLESPPAEAGVEWMREFWP